MKCSDCGNEMFLCGTFGAMWNCECGNVEAADEKIDEAVREFTECYRVRMECRNPKDVALGEALRRYRQVLGISMRDIGNNLGKTSAEISAWEMGFTSMTEKQVKDYVIVMGERYKT